MEDKVKKIIQDLCTNLMSFTSLDISNLIKKEFSSARHRDVAPIVRDLFVDNFFPQGYTRTLIDVELSDGTPTKTNLYHSRQVDPIFYVNRKQIPISPQIDNSKVILEKDKVELKNETGFNENELDCSVKNDGRVEIPISWVRKLNWTPGDQINIYNSNNKLSLIKIYDGTSTVLLTTKITPDGRCRVPKTAFDKIGFNSNNGTFLVRINSDRIEVESV